jgi:hypothetical protein
MKTKKTTNIVLYKSKDGSIQMDVQLDKETLWLSQAQVAELFATERSVVTKHLRNIFNSGELKKIQVCAKFAQTAADRKTYQTQFYNLDAIISVGYRVNSKRGTEFRIWATNLLKQHLVNGYSINEKRLKELKQSSTCAKIAQVASDVDDRREPAEGEGHHYGYVDEFDWRVSYLEIPNS